jgi:hypothetical protein
MKTIEELNGKWWYRLIKVVYILAFIGVALITCLIVSSSFDPQFDAANSYIVCNNSGDHIALKNTNVTLYYDYISSDDDTALKYYCASPIDLGTAAQEAYPTNSAYQSTSTLSLGQRIQSAYPSYDSVLDKALGFVPDNYVFVPVYTQRNWGEMILYMILSILVIAAIFEAAKRIFYYIFLGKFRPTR